MHIIDANKNHFIKFTVVKHVHMFASKSFFFWRNFNFHYIFAHLFWKFLIYCSSLLAGQSLITCIEFWYFGCAMSNSDFVSLAVKILDYIKEHFLNIFYISKYFVLNLYLKSLFCLEKSAKTFHSSLQIVFLRADCGHYMNENRNSYIFYNFLLVGL